MTIEASPQRESLFSKPSWFFKPGTATWLIRHHVRTRFRAGQSGSKIQKILTNLLLLTVFGVGTFTIGGVIASLLSDLNGNYDYPPYLLKAGLNLTAFSISLFGSCLIGAYTLLTDRDDLDLLLASPLPAQRILMARMLQSAYGSFFTAMMMGTLVFGYSIVTVDVRFALLYPVLFSIMLINFAISFVIARGLMFKFGLRRGRFVSMALGFVILIIGVLVFQVQSLLGTRIGDALLVDIFGPTVEEDLMRLVSPVGSLAFGRPVETLLLLTSAIVIFLGVGAYFWGRFANDAAFMAGQAQHVQKGSKAKTLRFSSGLVRNTLFKEWRTMSRDPYVLVQVATPLVTLIPISFSLWSLRETKLPGDLDVFSPMIGFLAVVFGGQIAGTLAWTAASLEEGGDLLLSSPSDGKLLFWSKALATAIPAGVFLIAAMMIVGLENPQGAAWGFGFGALGLTCCGAIEFLRPRPARRMKMMQRPDRATSSVILGLIFAMIWALATALAAIGLCAMGFIWATSPKSIVWLAKAPKVGAAGGPWKA
jgi:ABC-2 type transport system permease protein